MAIGYGLERAAYRPRRTCAPTATIIYAIARSSIRAPRLAGVSRKLHAFPQIIKSGLQLGGAIITNVQIAIIATSVVMMAGLEMWCTDAVGRERVTEQTTRSPD